MKKITLFFIGLLMVYFTIDNHVHLFPFNNLGKAGNQIKSTLIGVIPFTLILIGLVFRPKPAQKYSFIWAWVWLILQIWTWYIPYFQQLQPTWYSLHGYHETLRIFL